MLKKFLGKNYLKFRKHFLEKVSFLKRKFYLFIKIGVRFYDKDGFESLSHKF